MTTEQRLVKQLGFPNGRVLTLENTSTTARQVLASIGSRLLVTGLATNEVDADALLLIRPNNWQHLYKGKPPTDSANTYPLLVGADYRVHAILLYATWLGISPTAEPKALAQANWSAHLARVVLYFGSEQFARRVYLQTPQDQGGDAIALAPLPVTP